jgi:hypothetical protein
MVSPPEITTQTILLNDYTQAGDYTVTVYGTILRWHAEDVSSVYGYNRKTCNSKRRPRPDNLL